MLREIHIQNYAVIESLEVEFHPGLNVLTGETGSGKSILVDALTLALGGRASPEVIRSGADRAAVTAVFQANCNSGGPPWKSWLDRYDLGGLGEDEIILRREIQSSGRSRLLVNDEPVTVAAARELVPLLVEVHGQGEHMALTTREAQLDLLDAFSRTGTRLAEVRGLYSTRRGLDEEWSRLNQSEQQRMHALDLLRFQVSELDGAGLEPGEDEQMERERSVLRNLERVRTAAAAAHAAIYEDEGSALARLGAVERALDELERYDNTFESHREPLGGARSALDDLARALGDYLGRLEADPARLDAIEDRLALIDRLKRKYGGTLDEILAFAARARDELASLEHVDERREAVRRERESAGEAYRKAAETLSRERRAAGSRLSRDVQRELAQLGMEKARFEVEFGPLGADPDLHSDNPEVAGGPAGIDRITFLVSANPGEELRPLDRVASGGEVSRLMLALRTVLAAAAEKRDGANRTLVFDEIDSGIGGQVADCVGDRLKRLAHDSQVLCVTHLAQIASVADHHYSVEKSERNGRTFASVQYLDTERGRTQELARMLSGRHVTGAGLEHAAALLKRSSRR
jgi:DNA repair protein RecN (Recombination protein N)